MKLSDYFAIIVVVFFTGCRETSRRFDDFSDDVKEIYKRHPKIEASDPEHYKNDCKQEDLMKLNFPIDKVSYAMLYKGSLQGRCTRLSDKTLATLLKMLNDTSSYRWGEIGTPDFDNHIVFYNQADVCVGLAHVSYDGMVYTDPFIKKMKWGMVKEPVLDLIKGIGK
jgi:hypothetical protein